MSKIFYVLVIDDEPAMIDVIKTQLNASEFAITGVYSLADAFDKLKEERFDLVISDICLGDGLGTEIIEQDRFVKLLRNTSIIFMTGYDVDHKVLGKIQLLEKPFQYEELIRAVERLLKWSSSDDQMLSGPLDALIIEFGQELVIEVNASSDQVSDQLDVNLIIEDDDHQKNIPAKVVVLKQEECGDRLILTIDKSKLDPKVENQIQERMQKMQQAIMDFLKKAKGY